MKKRTLGSYVKLGHFKDEVLPYPFVGIFTEGVNLFQRDTLEGINAVVLWGGTDIAASLYGENYFQYKDEDKPSPRDIIEWSTIQEAVKRKILIIGICRGAQMLCAYAGGKIIQDVNGHHIDHMIETYKKDFVSCSSSHHQMMYPYDVKHELLAWCLKAQSSKYLPEEKLYCSNMDKALFKEPEVVWFPAIKGLAIQCHPEWHSDGDKFNKWILKEIEERL